MSEYIFDTFVDISEIDFSKSIIWVFYADKIPPHIGFSTGNVFFSLKVSGKDEHLNSEQVLEVIHRKKNSFFTYSDYVRYNNQRVRECLFNLSKSRRNYNLFESDKRSFTAIRGTAIV